MFVDEASGVVVRTDGLTQIPGLGIVGFQTRYEDFRDVGGMRLPFHTVAQFASQLIGRVITRLDESEIGVEVSAETFAAAAVPDE